MTNNIDVRVYKVIFNWSSKNKVLSVLVREYPLHLTFSHHILKKFTELLIGVVFDSGKIHSWQDFLCINI